MYRSIVVPLDGSPFAEQAVAVALAIAERGGAKVTLTRAWDPASYRYTSELTPPFLDPGAYERQEATEYLADLASRLRSATTATIDVAVLPGPPVDAIAEYLTSSGADLVVMSTHGLTGWSRAWIGSVADALLRAATVPVVLCRPQEVSRAVAPGQFGCVLIPLDGSEEAEQILAHAAEIAAGSVNRFVLLRIEHAVQMPTHPYPYAGPTFETDETATEQVVRHAKQYLTAKAEWLAARCPRATVEMDVRLSPHAASAIVAAAAEYDADLVALTTHARRVVRFVVGSVADKVLRGTHGSLLVLRPHTAHEQPTESDEVITNRLTGVVF
jgi:nucleotide-binding universal stress UspA family protein